MQNPIRAARIDVVADDFGVNRILDRLEGAGRNDAVSQERLDGVPAFGAQSVFHKAGAVVEKNDVVRRVVGL